MQENTRCAAATFIPVQADRARPSHRSNAPLGMSEVAMVNRAVMDEKFEHRYNN